MIRNTDKLLIQHFDGIHFQTISEANFGDEQDFSKHKYEDVNEFAISIKNEMNIGMKDVMKILGNVPSEEGQANRFHQEIGLISKDFLPLYLQSRFKENMKEEGLILPEEDSKMLKYTSDLTEMESLTDVALINFINLVSNCRVEDEYLSTALAIEVLRRKENLSLRSLANISNAFARPSRTFQSFVGFYQELKEPIALKLSQIMTAKKRGTWSLLDEDYNLDDVNGVLIGYSKTYNLTTPFLKILVKAGVEKLRGIPALDRYSKKKGVWPKAVVNVLHTISLNRKLVSDIGEDGLCVFDSEVNEGLEIIHKLFLKSYTSMKGFEICLTLKNLMLMNRFDEKALKILEWNVRTNRINFNISDVLDSLDTLLNFVNENKETFTEKKIFVKEGQFIQREPNLYDYLKKYEEYKIENEYNITDSVLKNVEFISEEEDDSKSVEDLPSEITINDIQEEEKLIQEKGEEMDILFESSNYLLVHQRATLDYLIELLNLLHKNIEKCHIRPILFNINYIVGRSFVFLICRSKYN